MFSRRRFQCVMYQDREINHYYKQMYDMHALIRVYLRLFRNSLLNVDPDSVTWLMISSWVSPAPPSPTFSSSPHGRGLLCWSGRGHCQCEGCTGDQRRPAEEHCRGAHQYLGASVRPLCPVLHWDLGEMLHSCQGGGDLSAVVGSQFYFNIHPHPCQMSPGTPTQSQSLTQHKTRSYSIFSTVNV